METENKDNLTGEFIEAILKRSGSIFACWGSYDLRYIPIGTPKAEGGGLFFKVHAYKYTGAITIIYQPYKDLFKVSYLDRANTWEDKATFCQEDIPIDSLISAIDGHIELTEDYDERVKGDYPLLWELYNGKK